MTGEETRLLELLGETPGYAVEVGAADGEFTSPTLVLERAGWTVMCVEPNPIFAAKARATRKLVIEAACADFESPSYPFTLCNVDHNCRLYEMQGGSSLAVQREHLERLGWTPKGERTINVKVRALFDLLHEQQFPRLDFISIDTEGTEDAVLYGLFANRAPKYNRWAPRVISVENWPGINKSDHILLPLGYRRIERVMGNYTDWYIL